MEIGAAKQAIGCAKQQVDQMPTVASKQRPVNNKLAKIVANIVQMSESTKMAVKETLNKSSHRRRPVSSILKTLDSGLRRNDVSVLNQCFLNNVSSEIDHIIELSIIRDMKNLLGQIPPFLPKWGTSLTLIGEHSSL